MCVVVYEQVSSSTHIILRSALLRLRWLPVVPYTCLGKGAIRSSNSEAFAEQWHPVPWLNESFAHSLKRNAFFPVLEVSANLGLMLLKHRVDDRMVEIDDVDAI